LGGINRVLDLGNINKHLKSVNSNTVGLLRGGRQALKHTVNNVFGVLGSMYSKIMQDSMTQQQEDARAELTAFAMLAKTVADTEQQKLSERENAMRDVGVIEQPVMKKRKLAERDNAFVNSEQALVTGGREGLDNNTLTEPDLEPNPKRSKTNQSVLNDLEQQARDMERSFIHVEGVSETENDQRTRNIETLSALINKQRQVVREDKEVERKIEDTNPLTGGLAKQAENAHRVEVISNTNVQAPLEIAAERLEIAAEGTDAAQGALTGEQQNIVEKQIVIPLVPHIRTKAQGKAFLRNFDRVMAAFQELCYNEDITQQQAAQLIRGNASAIQEQFQDDIRLYNNNEVPKEAEAQLELYKQVIDRTTELANVANDYAGTTEQRTMLSDEVAAQNYKDSENYLGKITKMMLDGDEESFKQARLDIARDDNPVTVVHRKVIENYMQQLSQAVVANIQKDGGEYDFRQINSITKLMNETYRTLVDGFDRTKVNIVNDFIKEQKRVQQLNFKEDDENEQEDDDDEDMTPEDIEKWNEDYLNGKMRVGRYLRGRLLRHSQKGYYQTLTVMETMTKALGVDAKINPGEILRDALKQMKEGIQDSHTDATQDDPDAVFARKQLNTPEVPADRAFNRFAEKQAKPLIRMKTTQQFEAWESKHPNAVAAVDSQAGSDLAKIRKHLSDTPKNQPLTPDVKNAVMSYLSSGYSYHRAKYNMFNLPNLYDLVGSKGDVGLQSKLTNPDDWINDADKRAKLADILVLVQNKHAGGDVVKTPVKPRVQTTTRVSDAKGAHLDKTAEEARIRNAAKAEEAAKVRAQKLKERKEARKAKQAAKK
jgi:hypothetical protein